MTGLALLCYLGRCETPESPFYGDTVLKGINFLDRTLKQRTSTAISDEEIRKWRPSAYAHGIATYALWVKCTPWPVSEARSCPA
jgi:hypothetical protein